jgi:hypothetical protein
VGHANWNQHSQQSVLLVGSKSARLEIRSAHRYLGGAPLTTSRQLYTRTALDRPNVFVRVDLSVYRDWHSRSIRHLGQSLTLPQPISGCRLTNEIVDDRSER